MSGQTILLVEDAEDIRELVAFNLRKEGYRVLEAASGEAGLTLARQQSPDVVILDVMLPGKDGYAVCRELGSAETTRHIPVIMLTARGDEVDRIVGFELGAVDYVVKPFSVRELLLRIRAVLKRQSATPVQATAVLHARGIELNQGTHIVSVHGEEAGLTVTEFAILHDLLLHKGLVRTREQILAAAWDNHFDGYARTVDAHVKRLRGKLGSEAELVETVRGIGYRLREA